MSEVNANINIGIDSSQALASLRTLQNQISSFNKSVIASNAQAMSAQKSALAGLTAQIGATKQFSTSIVNVESSVSRLGNAIDKNKLGLGEYFRYGVASSKNFGKVFAKEHTQMTALATERVKRLQTQYIALGAAQNGVTRAMAVRPLALFNADLAIAGQRQQLFSKLLNDGSTSLINFGKNTQWAGRQLMVGFTVPLTIFGGMAGKIFMDLERQVVNFRRVYGDAMTPAGETDQMVKEIQDLGKEFTKYGITVKDTVGLAGDIAATGAQGADLIAATAQSTRLATLGMIEMDQAMTATISLQTAFKLSNEELAQSVNFLNAVENQTVLSLGDVTEAIPKVAPVIMGLGGNVEDLAYFLTAMREGGVNAAEGANALKSGLASLINPTKGAREQLEKVGINIDSIISTNKGDIRATVQEFGSALMTLDKFGRQQTLAKVFGKYQFARLGALFENISTEGSQASRVIDLAGESIEDLAGLADKELGAIEESIGMKFTGALERLKLAIAPIGEIFLKIATPILEIASKILDKFNELSPGIKQFITILVAGVGVVAPTVIMLIGLFGNFIGQAVKGFAMFNNLFNRLRGGGKDLSYLAGEQLDATAAAATLEGQTTSLTAALNVQRGAVGQLARAYGTYVAAAGSAASGLPQGFRGRPAKGMATGGFVAGTGNKDTEPALLTPGEFVINADASKKFAPLLTAINEGSVGKYADGRTRGQARPISFGDLGSVDLSLFSQQSERSIQAMADTLSGATEQVRIEFMEILRGLETTQNVTKGIIQNLEQVKQSQFSEISSMAGDQRASFPGTESPSTQLSRQTGMSQAQIEAELQAARVSAQGAVDAVEMAKTEYVNVFRQLGIDAESISVEANMARAHTQNVDKSQGLAAWHANFWQMQSQAENQFLETGIKQSQRNQDFLMQFMGENEEAQVLMNRMTSGISLTEQEYEQLNVALSKMLTAVKSNPMLLTQGKGVSSSFLTQAIGAQGAYTARSEAGLSYGSPRSVEGMAEESLTALRTVNRSASPAETYAKEGDYAAQGYAKGIARSSDIPVKAADQMADRVVKATRSASRPQGPSGVSTNEINAQIKAEERAARRLRGPVVREGGISPLALREGEESTRILNKERSLAAALQEKENRDTASRQEEINKAHDLAIKENENLTKQTSATSKEMSISKGYAKKFGGALKNGSMKLTGAMFAMDGVVFAASMMNNSMGEFAQKIMPAVFAVQGFAMMMPMISGLFALLANPLIGIPVAIAAAAGGFFLMRKVADNMAKKGKDLSDAMYGTSKSVENAGAFFDKQSSADKIAKLKVESVTGQTQTSENLQQASEFISSELGNQLVKDVTTVRDQLGSKDASSALSNQLGRMLLAGVIDSDMAYAIATEVGKEIGDTSLSTRVSASLRQVLGPNGENLLDEGNRLEIFADIVADATSVEKSMEDAGLIWDGTGWIGQAIMVVNGLGVSDIAAENIAQNLINAQSLITEELARNQLAYDQGSISAKKFYKNNLDIINQARDMGATWESAIKTFSEAYDGEDITHELNTINQSLSDSLSNAMRPRLGKDFDKLFGNELKRAVDRVVNTDNGLDLMYSAVEVDLLDAESVSDGIASLTNDLGTLNEEIKRYQDQGKDTTYLEQQRDLIQEQLNMLTSEQKGIMNISVAVSSGILSVDTVANILEGNDIDMSDLSLMVSALPDESLVPFLTLLEQSGGEGVFTDFMLKITSTMSPEELLAISGPLIDLANMPPAVINTIMNELINGTPGSVTQRLNQIKQGSQELKKLKTAARVKVYMEDNFSTVVDKFSLDYNWIASLPPQQKYVYFDYITRYQTVFDKEIMQDAETRKRYNRGELGPYGTEGSVITPPTTTTKPKPDPEDTKDSGGSKTKSWLQQLIDDTKANLALFPKMLNQLKGMGIPQQIIEMIGGGEEGVKKAQELLNASKEKLKQLIKDFNKNLINEAVKGAQQERDKKNNANMATGILMMEGLSREDAESIASDPAAAQALLAASTDKTGKSTERLIKAYKELLAVPEYLDPVKNKLDEINNMYKAQMLPLQEKIDKQQEIVDAIQEEINALQDLNDSDQDKIRNLERQKEMKQREIEDYERLNELDERKVETLQRQDELRNRESEALSRELEALSDVEKKIRESYQERIDALEKVSEVNRHILEQQKQQLGLSQALSEGDIYAATAAAQQIRQTDAQFAQQQLRAGLEQGMENSVEGLRTSGGLTREQAEDQIKQIKEQSYQTSLLIRDIEDAIYARNQLMVPLKDQQLVIDGQIRDIADTIYNRESSIIKIQRDRLEPATKTLDNYTKQATELKKNLDVQSGLVEGADLLNDMTEEQIKAAGALGSVWHEVAKQIKQAREFAKGKIGKLIVPVRSEYKNEKAYKEALRTYNESVRAIRDQEQTEVDAAISSGNDALNKNMGGKIMKYAKGDMVGTRAMDSVPAMLTPGEYVIRKTMVDKYGAPMFDAINQGAYSMPKYNTQKSTQGNVKVNATRNTSINAPVYNTYDMKFSVNGSNANADDIANQVMFKMRQLQGQGIRNNRGY